MNKQEQAEYMVSIIEAWRDGVPLEFRCPPSGCWRPRPTDTAPGFYGFQYRIKQTRPTYPWAALHKRFKWCAVDGSGEAIAYTHKPEKHGYSNIWSSVKGGYVILNDTFAGYAPGNIDWRDTLEERPND
jgi:hypothetical protein